MHNHLLLAQKTIRELRERGVLLDPVDDIEHISCIMLAARRVDDPIDPEAARRAAAPCVVVGGQILRALPYGAQEGLERVLASGLCKDMDEPIVRAYASAHATDRALWQAETSPRAFLRAARRWARSITASLVEIATAVEHLHRQEYAVLQAVSSGGSNWGIYNMLETLMREYGHDMDYWIWQVPMDNVCGLLYAVMQKHEAQEREINKASKNKFIIDIDSWSFRAMVALTNERDRIAKEKQQGGEA